MQKTTMISILGLFSILVFSMSSIAMAESTELQVPLPPRNETQDLADWARMGLLPFIFNMQDANFSTGDVYYLEHTTNENIRRNLPLKFMNQSMNFNLSAFKTKLSDFIDGNSENPNVNLTFLNNLEAELADHTETTLNVARRAQVTKALTVKSNIVVIMWDNDTSVINAMTKIKNNETLTEQPFTGDEIFSIVRTTAVSEKIFGSFLARTQLIYENGSEAVYLRQFAKILAERPLLARNIIRDMNLEREAEFLRLINGPENLNVVITEQNARRNVQVGFSVSQIQINELNFAKRPNGEVFIKDLKYVYVDHQSMGLTIYNDTNDNGIMDLGMKVINPPNPEFNETVLPAIGDEAYYRVDFLSAQETAYTPAETVNDELSFAFSATDVAARLNPVMVDRDTTVFTDEFSTGGEQNIDSLGYTFHFEPNRTTQRAEIKFDYELGEWSNKSVLEGLGINHIYMTTVRNFDGKIGEPKALEENNPINASGSSVRSRKFQFQVGDNQIGEADLDSIPYLWDNTENVQAYGQTLPVLFAGFIFGSITANAENIQATRVTASGMKYLYSVSYPKFSGEEISHDPTYSMVTGVGAEIDVTDTTGTVDLNTSPDSAVPGFEIFSIIFIAPAIYFARKKKILS